MKYELTANEIRVLGALIEKEVTTPEQYPLSLNSLTTACNQKSNREPVLKLSETDVQDTVDGLMARHLLVEATGFGSRVVKYQHRFCNTEFAELKLSEQELGVLCLLFLRGPQTPGELRTRSNRLCRFSDVSETESVLQGLLQRVDGPFVVRLARQTGKRESRYQHLFAAEQPADHSLDAATEQSPVQSQPPVEGAEQRLSALELEVSELKQQLQTLQQLLDELLS